MLVAVYGTLKGGYNNHYILEGKRFLGPGLTVRKYSMVDSGFPVVISFERAKKKQHQVRVEVYAIGDDQECLDRLDRLEGEGHMYHRRVVKVKCGDQTYDCAMYVGADHWLRRGHSNPKFLRSDGTLSWPAPAEEYRSSTLYRTRMPRSGEQDDTGA